MIASTANQLLCTYKAIRRQTLAVPELQQQKKKNPFYSFVCKTSIWLPIPPFVLNSIVQTIRRNICQIPQHMFGILLVFYQFTFLLSNQMMEKLTLARVIFEVDLLKSQYLSTREFVSGQWLKPLSSKRLTFTKQPLKLIHSPNVIPVKISYYTKNTEIHEFQQQMKS